MEKLKFQYITDEDEIVSKTNDSIIEIEAYLKKEKVGYISLEYISEEVMRDIILKPLETNNSISTNDKNSFENLKKFKEKVNKYKDTIIMIKEIKVKKKFREKGIATELLNKALYIIKKNKNPKAITYIVAAEIEPNETELNKLEKLYSKFGFSNQIKEEKTILMFNEVNNIKYQRKKNKKRKENSI